MKFLTGNGSGGSKLHDGGDAGGGKATCLNLGGNDPETYLSEK